MSDFKGSITSALQAGDDVTISSPVPAPHVDAQIYRLSPTASAGTSSQGVQPSTPPAPVQNEEPLPSKTPPAVSAEADQAARKEKNPSEVLPPQGDFISCLKAETAWNNAISGNIESHKRLQRHQAEFRDELAFNKLCAELSSLPLLKIRDSISSDAKPPIEFLPPEIRELVRQIAGGDLGRLQGACACLLGLTFVAARGNWSAKDAYGNGQTLNDGMILSAPSGWGKSKMLEIFATPFTKFEAQLQRDYFASHNASHSKAGLLGLKAVEQSLLASIRKACRKTGDPEAAVEAFQDQLAEVLEQKERLESEIETVPRLILDRVTMEQLSHELAAQGNVAAIIGDEGGILRQIRPDNCDIFVKGATGEASSTSTLGSGMVAIPHPCLAVLLLVQPSKLEFLFGNDKLVGCGVAARFLPVLPFIGPNGIMKPNNRVDGTWFYKKAHSLLVKRERIRIGKETRPRYTLEIGVEATALLDDFNVFEGKTTGERDDIPDGMRHFLDRLPWHAKNLAGALHLLKYPDPEEHAIDEETMAGGIAFAKFFRSHAEVAYDPTSRDGVVFAPKILKWMRRNHLPWFTVREACRGVGHCKAEQIRAGLDELERANVVRQYFTGARQKMCIVHPAVYAANSGF